MSTIAAVNGNRTAVGLHLFRPTPGAEPAPAPEFHLTARQQEVIELIAEGGRAKVIAARLGIADHRAQSHPRDPAPARVPLAARSARRGETAPTSPALTLGPVRICPPRLTFGEPIPGKMQGAVVVVVLATLLLAPAAARAAGRRRSSTTVVGHSQEGREVPALEQGRPSAAARPREHVLPVPRAVLEPRLEGALTAHVRDRAGGRGRDHQLVVGLGSPEADWPPAA